MEPMVIRDIKTVWHRFYLSEKSEILEIKLDSDDLLLLSRFHWFGCFLKMVGFPNLHPKSWSIFSRKNLWFQLGISPPLFRSCPHIYITYHTNILTTITTITLTYLTLLYLTVHGITYTLVCPPSQQQWKPKNPTGDLLAFQGPDSWSSTIDTWRRGWIFRVFWPRKLVVIGEVLLKSEFSIKGYQS